MPHLLPLLLALAPNVLLAGETLAVVGDVYRPAASVVSDPRTAEQLFEQGKSAAAAGEVSVALQLATETLRHNPDHAGARQVLGYEQVGDQWLTAFQRKQIERGFVWDPRFGWLKAEDLPRYEAGERRDGRRWRTTEEDAKRHALIEDGWRVRTDHFQVTTNHSLAAAAELTAELESLFQVWRQLFAGYYLGEAEVRARFEGTRTARSRSRPFNVFYHRTKEGYVAHLRHKNPLVAESLGVYFDDLRQAHFFAEDQADPKQLRATLYHEAVHQLFQESKRAKQGVGGRDNFWAVEGVACYFESLMPARTGDRHFAIGHVEAGRLPAARHRLLVDKYLVPLDEMAALGMKDLQRRTDLSRLYGQATAVTTFLMHADGGRRREAFVRYLANLYAGKTRPDSLAEQLGEPWPDLERSYERWMADPVAAAPR